MKRGGGSGEGRRWAGQLISSKSATLYSPPHRSPPSTTQHAPARSSTLQHHPAPRSSTTQHAPSTTQHAPCATQHAPCATHHAPCATHHAMHRAPDTTLHIPHTARHTPRATHRAPYTFPPHSATFRNIPQHSAGDWDRRLGTTSDGSTDDYAHQPQAQAQGTVSQCMHAHQ